MQGGVRDQQLLKRKLTIEHPKRLKDKQVVNIHEPVNPKFEKASKGNGFAKKLRPPVIFYTDFLGPPFRW